MCMSYVCVCESYLNDIFSVLNFHYFFFSSDVPLGTYIHTHTRLQQNMHMIAAKHMHACMCMHVYFFCGVRECMYACVYICICVYVLLRRQVCVWVCMYVCMYVCTHTYMLLCTHKYGDKAVQITVKCTVNYDIVANGQTFCAYLCVFSFEAYKRWFVCWIVSWYNVLMCTTLVQVTSLTWMHGIVRRWRWKCGTRPCRHYICCNGWFFSWCVGKMVLLTNLWHEAPVGIDGEWTAGFAGAVLHVWIGAMCGHCSRFHVSQIIVVIVLDEHGLRFLPFCGYWDRHFGELWQEYSMIWLWTLWESCLSGRDSDTRQMHWSIYVQCGERPWNHAYEKAQKEQYLAVNTLATRTAGRKTFAGHLSPLLWTCGSIPSPRKNWSNLSRNLSGRTPRERTTGCA